MLRKSCGDQFVDIRIQNPMDYGFNVEKIVNKAHQMTIEMYCAYQQHSKDQTYKKKHFGDLLDEGKVFFGVNFEP